MSNKKDITEKMFEDYADVFSDIINGLLFKGRQIVTPEQIVETKTRSMLKCEGDIHEQERDVAKFWEQENSQVRLALFGGENQTQLDKYMTMRVMGYDGASYKEQVNLIKRKSFAPYPVVTLVLYFGEERWTAARSLHELLKGHISDQLLPYVSDYKINVFEIAWLSEEEANYFKSDFRFVVDYFR